MKVVEAQGYNKEKALESTGLDVKLDQLKNATLAWKKAGSPMNSKELNRFVADYVKRNKLIGAYLVVEASSDDTRLRPYSVINETTNGKRKTKTTYQIKEADFVVKYHTDQKTVVNKETGEEKVIDFQSPYRKETVEVEVVDKETGSVSTVQKEISVPDVKVTAVGAVEAKADKKDEALALLKDLIETNKKDYVVEIVKEVTEGQRYAAYGQYSPSKSAKLGKFIFFVQE